MGNNFKRCWRKLLITVVYLSLHTFNANSQTAPTLVVAATSFDPLPGNGTRSYIGLNDIVHTGVLTGNLSVTPTFTPSANPDIFNAPYHYAITNNPNNLDKVRYSDTPGDYMFVYSPKSAAAGTNQNILEYTVVGLVPGSDVTVSVDYCSVVSATYATCGGGSQRNEFKAGINLDQYNQLNGSDATQIGMGECASKDFTGKVDAAGNMVFRMNATKDGACTAMGIKSLVVKGFMKPIITALQGTEVCAGEQITLQGKQAYNGQYQWQANDGGGWTNIGTSPAQLYELKNKQDYKFRLQLIPTGSTTPIVSDEITVKSIQCCEENGAAASRQTIYLDDFGRVDLNDKTGKTYYVWNYSNVLNPVEDKKTTTTPFRWPLTDAISGITYEGSDPPNDGEYTVASYMTNGAYNGYAGSALQWANKITGPTTIPNPDIGYDHSGKLDGAALLINFPPNTGGVTIYNKTIDNLCFGKLLFFECWIAVFTNSANGTYKGVDVNVKLTDGSLPTNTITLNGKANRQADGGGVWVRIAGQITLSSGSKSLKMEIINNQNVPEAGNDLVLDDIKIMACAPPTLELFFDLATLSKKDTVCTKKVDLFTKSTEMLKKYYANDPKYLYQWTKTPTDYKSWKNLDIPQGAEVFSITDPKTNPAFAGLVNGDKVYFRVVAATDAIFTLKNNFQGTGNEANLNDPCKNYSVSAPIEATVICPACAQPTSITVKNGTTTVANNGIVTTCEGSAVTLNLAGVWPAPSASLTDKSFEFYVKNKTTNTEIWKSPTPIDGGATATSTGGSDSYAITAANVVAALAGDYIVGIRNMTCLLEQTVKIAVNKKILNNAIIANDTICAGGTPIGFKQDPAKNLSGDYTGFKWQSGASATGTFTDITSATLDTYKPAAPNTNTAGTYYYRRVAIAKKDGTNAVCADSTSKPVALVVQPAISGNTITLTSNPVCSGREASFTGSTVAGATYQWIQSTQGANGPWSLVANQNQSILKVTVDKSVSATYNFRRIVKVGKCADTTGPVKVDVIDGMKPGSIDKDQTICLGQNAAGFNSTATASGGTGTGVTYLWQSASTSSGPWSDIGSQTNTTYTPPKPTSAGVTYFRRRATNGSSPCDTAYSNTVKLTVAAPPVAEITQPMSVLSTDATPSKSTTTRNPSIFVQAKDPSAAYMGEWKITNGRGAGLKGGNLKAFGDSLLLLAFGQTTTAVWTVQDTAKACTPATATVVVTRKNFTLPEAGPDDTICITSVGTYKLKGNAFTAGDEVGTWELVNPAAGLSITQNPADATEASITVPGAGVYEFRYRIVNSVLNENNTDVVKITVDAEAIQPTLPRPDVSICVKEFKLEASQAQPTPTAVGTWKAAVGQTLTTQIIETPNDPTSWVRSIPLGVDTKLTWEVKNGVCPVKSVDFTIHQVGELSNPTISLNGTLIKGSDTTLCDGTAYTLTSNTPLAGESGAWTAIPGGSSIAISPGGSTTSQAVTINKEGNTDVIWTMSKTSCPDAPRKVTFKVFKKPTLQPLVGSPICEEQNGTYIAKSVIPATNDTLPITTYNWYSTPNTPSGSKGVAIVQGADDTATGEFKFTSTATTGATDKATVFVTATNFCGTSVAQSLEVTINLKPRDFNGAITGLSPICESSTLDQDYTIPAQTNTTIHNWTLDGNPLTVLAQPAVNVTVPIANLVSTTTTKELVVQLENACGKGVSDTFEIKIIPAIPVVAKLSGYDTVCLPRDGFTYTATSPNAGTNPTYLFSIIHSDGSPGKTQGSGSSNTFSTAVGDVKDGSKILVEITGDPLTGCFTTGSGKDSLIIDGYEYPDTTVTLHSNDTVCFGNKVIFSIDNTKKGNTVYTWYKDNNPVKSSAASFIELSTRAESGLYKVKIDNLVCDSRTSGDHRARIFDQPKVQFNPNEVLMEIAVTPNSVLTPEITGLTGDSLTQVAWSPTDLLTIPSPLSTTATFTPPPAGGQFMYSIFVATGEGRVLCPADASIKIFALPPVRVPNAFSPNNDGLNELWQIDGIEAYPRAQVVVYNRWGNKMFEAKPYNGQNGWDGTAHGAKLPMGTYYYVIDLNENTVVQSRYLTGSLTIVH